MRLWIFLLLLPVLVFAAGCTSSTHRQPGPLATPVVLVHGYNNNPCPGSDVLHSIWGGLYVALKKAGWTAPVLPVSFYECDKDGVDITGYGPTPPSGGSAALTAQTPRVHYTGETPIEQIAHDLAWFVYDTYSKNKEPVDLVGHSMGGLIVRTALYHVATHDRLFPPSLYVTNAVTISSPHRGFGGTTSNVTICGAATVECSEFATDSAFMTNLERRAPLPQGTGGTKWTVIGSSAGCDFVPIRTSLGMPGAVRIDYLSPCYGHGSYLWDLRISDTASILLYSRSAVAPVRDTHAPHALALLVRVLMQQSI